MIGGIRSDRVLCGLGLWDANLGFGSTYPLGEAMTNGSMVGFRFEVSGLGFVNAECAYKHNLHS